MGEIKDDPKPWPLITSTLDRAPNPVSPDAPPRCAGMVFSDRVQHWQCTRRGYAEHAGRWYCKQHHPPTVQARTKEADRRYNAEQAAAEERGARARRYVADLGFGTEHWHTPIGGSTKGSGYTGGIVLTEDEARALVKFLVGGHQPAGEWRTFWSAWEAGHVGTDA